MSGTAALKKISGGVTAAKGFKAASTAAGIKYKERKDMRGPLQVGWYIYHQCGEGGSGQVG